MDELRSLEQKMTVAADAVRERKVGSFYILMHLTILV